MKKDNDHIVDFLLIGAMKAGTESIYDYFRRHPRVIIARDKQQHYFCQGLFGPNYKGLETEIYSLEEYRGCVPALSGEIKIGDFDCATLHGPRAPQLIKQANPNVKIMAILRNPIERAYSHYWMDVRECFEARPFLQAVKEDYLKYRSGSKEYCPLIRLGFYTEQIKSFTEYFGKENVRIWLYEDYCQAPAAVLQEMAAFIGVELPAPEFHELGRVNEAAVPRSRIAAALLHARRGKLRVFRQFYLKLPISFRRYIKTQFLVKRIKTPPIERSARQLLGDIYRDDVFALQALLGRDLTHWLRDQEGPLQLPVELQLEQKAKQAEYFDSAVDPEFEIERPVGAGRLYEWSIESKFNKAASMLDCPLYGFRLLDICCGSGMGAENYAVRGALVTGLDISELSLARARERARRHQFEANFLPGDAEKLPFPDKSFDIVAVHDGLHHLPDPHRAIAEMVRVAARGIVIIEPARSWLTRRAVKARLALDYEEAGNFVYRLREKEIYKIAIAAGYKKFKYRQFLLYYRHEPFRWAKYIENTPLFYLIRFFFATISWVAPRLGNKICVVCERD